MTFSYLQMERQLLLDLRTMLLVGQIVWCLEDLKYHKMKYLMERYAQTHLDSYALALEVA